MATASGVPVTVTPEAAARVVELGMQREFEQMLEHTRQTVPNLQRVEVSRYDDPDEPGQPRVVIEVWVDEPGTEQNPVSWDWGRWFGATFPPHVCRWFGFSAYYRGEYDR